MTQTLRTPAIKNNELKKQSGRIITLAEEEHIIGVVDRRLIGLELKPSRHHLCRRIDLRCDDESNPTFLL